MKCNFDHYNMDNRAILIDTFAVYGFHEVFNSSILIEASKTYHEVIYYGTKSSITNLQKNVVSYNIDNVKFRFLPQIHGGLFIQLFIRYIISAIFTLLLIAQKHEGDLVILNNNPFLSVLYPIIRRKIVIFCHGEMELLEKNNIGKFAKLQAYMLRFSFINRTLRDNIRFVVLGDSILVYLKNIIPLGNYKRFCSMDHPYIFNNDDDVRVDRINDEIKIGIVGITTPSKGLMELNLLLDKKNPKIHFYHIGKISDVDGALRKKGLYVVKRDAANNLSRIEYNSWIRRMDYLLFLYPSDNYRLTASGAIFESFSNFKPMICLSNNYFDYIFGKAGDIGYLFNSVDEMICFLSNFCFDKRRYESQIDSLRRGRALFSVESQVSKFEEIARNN